jgi:Rrf2 family protein
MIELAKNFAKGPLKREEISKSQDISSSYLENILIALKSRNLIRTIRGANGGFSLIDAPEKITMYDVVTALEGPIEPVHCIENSEQCTRSEHCAARMYWISFHEVQVTHLKSTTLQTLLDMEKKIQGDYCI